MPVSKDTVMLKPDSRKVLIAMAAAEIEPKELAEAAGIPKNIVYTIRRGYYAKPKYIGAIARVLQVEVTDLIEDKEGAGQSSE
ncbi:helix-turn-helix domain-containing protein [Parablautia intestinalis]|uniref:helix-turn-helix domain-containing protein n=1 Tax=Parablautia intestinalis TaxID=2320100 RepID=UPI00256F41A7|nr:helix-turn-helix transcriptional regulator [Parablautia intestinalis]